MIHEEKSFAEAKRNHPKARIIRKISSGKVLVFDRQDEALNHESTKIDKAALKRAERETQIYLTKLAKLWKRK